MAIGAALGALGGLIFAAVKSEYKRKGAWDRVALRWWKPPFAVRHSESRS